MALEYLVIPYTDKDKEIENFRALMSDFIFSELSKEGRVVIAPISMGHGPARRFGLPTDWKFWAKVDSEILKVCDRILIVKLPGWQDSVGVSAEIKLAKELEKEIIFIDPTNYLMKYMAVEINSALTVPAAFNILSKELNNNDQMAAGWYQGVSSAVKAAGGDASVANKAASVFLQKAFGKVVPVPELPKTEVPPTPETKVPETPEVAGDAVVGEEETD